MCKSSNAYGSADIHYTHMLSSYIQKSNIVVSFTLSLLSKYNSHAKKYSIFFFSIISKIIFISFVWNFLELNRLDLIANKTFSFENIILHVNRYERHLTTLIQKCLYKHIVYNMNTDNFEVILSHGKFFFLHFAFRRSPIVYSFFFATIEQRHRQKLLP